MVKITTARLNTFKEGELVEVGRDPETDRRLAILIANGEAIVVVEDKPKVETVEVAEVKKPRKTKLKIKTKVKIK